ncbi:hypothetical protein [Crocinitomix catalasitica]|uniref:hypothetical protein n=1 Tax=Crocinitomix catalasitica TaxID=184607 RepID=UPI0004803A12|nr:hypothetical protein [Crocinitomix catalasitica]
MKKLLVFAVVVGGLATMTSCKKDYTCTYDDGTVTTYEKMGKTLAGTTETACQLGGGTWSSK